MQASSIEAPSTYHLRWSSHVTGSCITGYDLTGNDVTGTGSREPEMKGR